MTDTQIETLLMKARQLRQLRRLCEESGIGYSYISKLAQGRKPLQHLSGVYKQALEQGLQRLFEGTPQS